MLKGERDRVYTELEMALNNFTFKLLKLFLNFKSHPSCSIYGTPFIKEYMDQFGLIIIDYHGPQNWFKNLQTYLAIAERPNGWYHLLWLMVDLEDYFKNVKIIFKYLTTFSKFIPLV